MNDRYKLAGMALTLGVAALTTPADAAPAWEFTTAGHDYSNGDIYTADGWDFATAFTMNADAVVSGLGYYASAATGRVDPAPVVLYECADAACATTGTAIASATVDNTYAIDGHFRYVKVAPVTLEAGKSYEVAGVSGANAYTWNDVGYADNPAITRLNGSGSFARWQPQSTPAFLTGSPVIQSEIADGYLGPNVFFGSASDFTGAPEPAAWTMLIAGFGGIGAVLRRRRRQGLAIA